MKKLALVALAVTGISLSSTVAFALDATQRVTFVDHDAGVIWLNNGDSITAPAGFDLATLKIGLEVNVTYDNAGTAPFTATALTVVTAA